MDRLKILAVQKPRKRPCCRRWQAAAERRAHGRPERENRTSPDELATLLRAPDAHSQSGCVCQVDYRNLRKCGSAEANRGRVCAAGWAIGDGGIGLKACAVKHIAHACTLQHREVTAWSP